MKITIEIPNNPNLEDLIYAFFNATDYCHLTRDNICECEDCGGACDSLMWCSQCEFAKEKLIVTKIP